VEMRISVAIDGMMSFALPDGRLDSDGVQAGNIEAARMWHGRLKMLS